MRESIKLGRLVEIEQELSKFLEYRFKTPTTFRLLERSKPIIEKLAHYHDVRSRMFKEFGEPVYGGAQGDIRIKDEHIDKFHEELQALADVEVDLDLPLLSHEEIRNGATSDEISALVLIRLEDIVFDIEARKQKKARKSQIRRKRESNDGDA